jgi:hypothetical protein
MSELRIGIVSQRETVGPDPEERHCWLCYECGKQGAWTFVESKAVRGMHIHKTRKHRSMP